MADGHAADGHGDGDRTGGTQADPPTVQGREFFRAITVADALAAFQPTRRTAVESVAVPAARGRIPTARIHSPTPLPGFARSTVDGYAVRAADTFGASEGLPSYLEVVGAVRMGAAPTVAVPAGGAVTMPTGGALPQGADAVVMVEHTQVTMPATIEVTRPVAPGENFVRADEDIAVGADLVPAGRPLRAQDLGVLAAAGVTEVAVHARPRVAVLSTGDEVVPPSTPQLEPGQVRDATASALAGLIEEAGGVADLRGIVPDDAGALDAALRSAMSDAEVVVVSAGSSVGARDETAGVVAGLGPPGIFCHGLAVKPGKPTLLAECDGIPIIGLPGNPLSALVVFRMVGLPLVRRVGGWTVTPVEPISSATLTRPVASAAGRRDVVQVRLGDDGTADPLTGASALLSLLTQADGYLVVDEAALGLDAGATVEVTHYR